MIHNGYIKSEKTSERKRVLHVLLSSHEQVEHLISSEVACVEEQVVSTGIELLDKELCGGFLKGQIILLAGNPGSGKTTFGVQFLADGLQKGEPGIFVGLVEPKEDFMKYMWHLGFYLEEYEAKGQFLFIESLTAKDPAELDLLVDKIVTSALKMGAKRIVIDSLTAMEVDFSSRKEIRTFLHNRLLRALKNANLTAIAIVDVPYGEEKIGTGIEEFIFDGVLQLSVKKEKGLPRRQLTVKKFRAKDLSFVDYDLIIGLGGIILISPFASNPSGTVGDLFLSSGIEGLDDLLGGGFREGTLSIIMGPSGSGKTQLSYNYVLEGARRDELSLYVSFEESEEQIRKNMLGIAPSKSVYDVLVISQGIMGQTPYKLVETQRGLISRVKPKRIVLDGIKSLKRMYGEEYYQMLIRSLANLYKETKVTAIMTAIGDVFEESELATLADNLVCLDLRKDGNHFVRDIGVVKARGTKIGDAVKTIYFSEGGKLYVDQ